MPRRPPPTSLKLVQGPCPPRSTPRHRLPSVPRPTALVSSEPAVITRGLVPPQQLDLHISIPTSLPTAVLSSSPLSGRGSMRGPWDHSGSISLDVSTLLTPLEPVALAA
ncbi:hypothetical protein FB45DRAFT_911987 [Roridomyces roridus]|uniref:Uncharacterized protein n=1 Tax=Roridomyces roridus TaxID=1738132 RepID=A0AAD7BW77_9AGAR|nr:hypothetical protein FB45DRAFT_911987 [Roridomyces roridus]